MNIESAALYVMLFANAVGLIAVIGYPVIARLWVGVRSPRFVYVLRDYDWNERGTLGSIVIGVYDTRRAAGARLHRYALELLASLNADLPAGEVKATLDDIEYEEDERLGYPGAQHGYFIDECLVEE